MVLKGLVMEYIRPSYRIKMATLDSIFWYKRPKQSELQAVRPGSGNHYNHGRVGVKVICGFPSGGGTFQILIITMYKLFTTDLIGNCFTMSLNCFADIIQIDLNLNRCDAKPVMWKI